MKIESKQHEIHPIVKLNGLLNSLANSPTINQEDMKKAYREIGHCFTLLKQEIDGLKVFSNQIR